MVLKTSFDSLTEVTNDKGFSFILFPEKITFHKIMSVLKGY